MSDVDYASDVSDVSDAAPAGDSGAAPVSEGDPPSTPETVTQDELLSAVYREMNGEAPGQYRDPVTGRWSLQPNDQAQIAGQEQGYNSAITAPQSWSADAKAAWDQVPPHLQEVIAQRDTEAQQFISRQGNEIGYYRDFAGIWEHGRQAFEQLGWDDQTAMHTLVDYVNHYAQDPFGAIHRLAQEAGVDLYQALGVTPQHGVSPDLAAIYAQNSEFQRRLENFERQATWREQAESRQRLASLENQVVEFSRDKPDFEELSQTIIGAIPLIREAYPDMGPDEVLHAAYEAVRWGTPHIREQLIQQEMAGQEQQRMQEAQQRVREARNGQALNVRSSPANSHTPKSAEDTMRETYRRMQRT